MADEITVQAGLGVDNNYFELPFVGGQFTFDQAGIGGAVPGVISVGTSEEDVDLSELSTQGWCFLRNLDTNNYVQWGKKDGSGNMQAIGRLEPGDPAVFRMEPGATLRMKANTAACKVLIWVIED